MSVGAASAQAQFTWTGGSITDGSVSHAANWFSGMVPTGSGTENVTFGDITGTQSNVIIPSSLALNNIDFSGAETPSYVFSGTGSLTINGYVNVAGTAPSILFDATLGLKLGNGTHAVDVASGATLTVNGVISQSGTASITLNGNTGSGVLALTGANTFSGGVTVTAGELSLGSSSVGSPGAVTSGPVGTGTLTFASNTEFTLTQDVTLANAIVLGGDGNRVENEDGGSYNLTLSGYITGSGGIDWCTSGALTLGNTTSDFTGGVDLRTGTLFLRNSDVYTSGSIVSGPLGTGTLILDNNTTLSTASGTPTATIHNPISLSEGTVTIDTTNGHLLLFGAIDGDAGLKVIGTHSLTLGGDTDFSGGVAVHNGATLYLADSSFLDEDIFGPVGSSDLKLYNGSTLGVSPFAPGNSIGLLNNIALDCNSATTVTFDTTNGNLTLNGVISGAAGVLLNGPNNRLVLTNANTYSGGTTIHSGYFVLGTGGSIQGNVQFTGADITGQGELRFESTDPTTTFSGDISGVGRLSIFATGNTTTLGGTNTYTGGTFIHDGTLADGATGKFAPNSDVYLHGGGTLQVNYDDAVGGLEDYTENSITTSGAVTIASNKTLTVNTGGSSVFSGVISGSGAALTTAGSGTLILGGDNTYTGITTIGNGGVQLGNGGTTGTVAGNIVDNYKLAFNHSGTGYSFGGLISGSGDLYQLGTGTLTLSSANLYTGNTYVNSGTGHLVIGHQDALPSTTGLSLAPGTSLDVNFSDTIQRFIASSGSFVNLASGVVFKIALPGVAGNGTQYDGVISGNGSVEIGASDHIVAFGGDDTYTGGTTINSGAGLQIGEGGSAGSVAGNIADNGALTFYRLDSAATNTYSGVISGTGSVTNSGGTLILTGTNAYSGGTTINGGTMVAGNNSAFGTGGISLTSNATLGVISGSTISNPLTLTSGSLIGNGAFAGTVTAGSNIRIAPENTGGTATVATLTFNNLTLGNGGAYYWDMLTPGSSAGNGWDLISVSNNLNLSGLSAGGFTIDLVSLSASATLGTVTGFSGPQSFTILSAGSITGFSAANFSLNLGSWNTNIGQGTFTISQAGNNLQLNFSPVPEPSTWALLGLGLLGLPLAWRRRRRVQT